MNGEKIADGMMYGGGGSAFIFGWDANTVGMIGGLLIGLAGLALSFWFQRRRDKREQAEHEQRMRELP